MKVKNLIHYLKQLDEDDWIAAILIEYDDVLNQSVALMGPNHCLEKDDAENIVDAFDNLEKDAVHDVIWQKIDDMIVDYHKENFDS